MITFLTSLDLSRNLLKALPVEFTDIFESVPTVELLANPWSDLPDRWGHIWSGMRSTDAPGGYNVAEVRMMFVVCNANSHFNF